MTSPREPRERLRELQQQAPEIAARARELLRRQDELLSGCVRPSGPLADAVLLVHVPPADRDLPPLELAYELEFLRHAGYRPRLLDAAALTPAATDEALAEEIDRAEKAIVGLYVVSENRAAAIRLSGRLKKNAARFLFLFGPGLAEPPAAATSAEIAADALVIGPPEITVVALLEAIAARRDPAALPGVLCPGATGRTPYRPRPPLAEADQMPAPTYEDFDPAAYRARALPLAFNPGGAAARPRSAARLVAEMRDHLTRWGVRHFVFLDAAGTVDHRRLDEFATLLAAADLAVRFRLDLGYAPEPSRLLAHRLARAGCFEWRLPRPADEIQRAALARACLVAAEAGITVTND
ncbi:MAG: hypothetical protein GX444_20015 [Myxococcales bacterium]|nr:hypothetical protein [Myxococcales bacterium]